VTDRPPDEPAGPTPTAAAEGVPEDAAPTVAGQDVQRRAFLRQLTGEAVVTTARLAGLSAAVRRSLVAAGESVARDLDPPAGETAREPDPSATEVPAARPDAGEASASPASMASAGARPARQDPPFEPGPAIALTPRQHEILRLGATAVLGVNDASGAPHLTSSIYDWDGATLRLPAELFAARAERVGADPRVSVLVKETSSDAWVAVTGWASIVSGADVETEMLPILRKYMSDDEADRLWTEMRSSGDPVVIRVRPTRLVWRLEP
jgi:Pyridoxamine 5'-phosphate oxidase